MNTPQIGEKYRHYKSTGGNDYTYEIIGIALHTETEEDMVIYKPLYGEQESVRYFARPLSMRFEEVEIDGTKKLRFEKIG